MNTLSIHWPLPSMLMRVLAFLRTSSHAALVDCARNYQHRSLHAYIRLRRAQYRQRRRGRRHRRAEVATEERGDGRGDLRLGHGRRPGARAERGRVRTDDRDPDVLGAALVDAVLLPFLEPAAAAMIAGDDEGRSPAVLRDRLHRLPELAHERVHVVGALEHEVVMAYVRPPVGLAVAHEQHARPRRLHVIDERDLQEGVPDVARFELNRLLVELLEQLLTRAGAVPRRLHRSRLQYEVAAWLVEDVLEGVPGRERGHPAVQVGRLVQPLVDADVRIRAVLVAVDARVRMSGQHLVVARVGEGEPVRDPGNAAVGLVAEELALLSDHLPEERKQQPAAHRGIVVPEALPKARLALPDAAVLHVEERGIGAREDLLPTKAIADDQDHVVGLALRKRRRTHRERKEREVWEPRRRFHAVSGVAARRTELFSSEIMNSSSRRQFIHRAPLLLSRSARPSEI